MEWEKHNIDVCRNKALQKNEEREREQKNHCNKNNNDNEDNSIKKRYRYYNCTTIEATNKKYYMKNKHS